ncbi:MAG: hypothetical protein WAT93_12885 [Pontixanthobacter sp.]
MKNIAIYLAAFTAALASPAIAADGETDRSMAGVYAGSYNCMDGEHGFYLDVSIDGLTDDGDQIVSGTLGVFPTLGGENGAMSSVSGSFAVTGTIDAESMLRMTPGDWLVQPDFYGAAELEGKVWQGDKGLWQINGKPIVPGNPDYCSELIATQFLPSAP